MDSQGDHATSTPLALAKNETHAQAGYGRRSESHADDPSIFYLIKAINNPVSARTCSVKALRSHDHSGY